MNLSKASAIAPILLMAACASVSPAPIESAPAPATETVTAMVPPAGETAGSGAPARDGAAEMARKLQNPLASIRALFTDGTVGFNTGEDEGTSWAWSLQPVYAIDIPDLGFTFLPRAVVPILGIEPGTNSRLTGLPSETDETDRVFGLGDSALQLVIAPHMGDAKVKFGLGPQVSLKTRTDDVLGGAGWGAGLAGVMVTDLTPDLSFTLILGNMWSFDEDFNSMSVQPLLFYNFADVPGLYVGYNAVTTANWEAGGDNRWTVPLGFSVGRTFDMGGGHGLDVSIGPYYNVVRPDGAADWMIRFGISWVFP